ncbi:hypothetical protein [Piscirickettsia salmonis]|uniref:hypothetical protein n=1 Tax=Piscirickettsia salmonis TaxID=1238 RepID=UPI0007C9220D|nr:hypothetical protein A0O36_02389 [Piscirickettsiaceae bacterium NZ-RLO1]
MGLKLEYIDGNGESTNFLERINQILAPVFVKIYPIDLRAISESQQLLLSKITLNNAEKVELLSYFTLNREQIIEKIKDSGREPNVAGGGFLETRAVDLKIDYPAIFVKCDGDTYSSEFKATHSNLGLDGVTGVDEVVQLLSGGEILKYFLMPDNKKIKLSLTCDGDKTGWMLVSDGKFPHYAAIPPHATTGTKIVAQAIGPALWEMKSPS